MSDRPQLAVVIASTRPGRRGDVIAAWFVERALAHGFFDVEVVDLAAVNLPLYDEPQQPTTRAYAHEHTKRWSATVSRVDAFVIVMPEYNHSFNAALKNALDYLYFEWRDKAVGLVGYGGVASGTRAMQALKPVLLALKLVFAGDVAINTNVTPVIDGSFRASDALERSAAALLGELSRLEEPLHTLRLAARS